MAADGHPSRQLAHPAIVKLSLLLLFPGALAAGVTDGASLTLLLVPGVMLVWTGISWLRDSATWDTFVRLTEGSRGRATLISGLVGRSRPLASGHYAERHLNAAAVGLFGTLLIGGGLAGVLSLF